MSLAAEQSQALAPAHAEGCLLGTMVGESLGLRIDGQEQAPLAARYADFATLEPGPYGGATEMTAAVAASLEDFPAFDGADMARRLLAARSPSRRYGAGTITSLDRLAAGAPWNEAGVGSGGRATFGNGAAVRSAPVGLLYGDDVEMLRWVAEEGAAITHQHALGTEAAVLHALAVAIALASRGRSLSAAGFLLSVGAEAHVRELRSRYEGAAQLAGRSASARRVIDKLGNGTSALGSVATAAYCFALRSESFEDAVCLAASLGGNAAAICAMTGSLSGAYLGVGAIPERWLERLEAAELDRARMAELAQGLVKASLQRSVE